MSYQAVRAVLNCPQVKGAQRMALVVLAEHANDHGLCWPSMTTIARETGVSPRQAKRLIHGLEEQGFIAIEYGVGLNHPNKYRLSLPANGVTGVTIPAAEKVTSGAQMVTSRVVNSVTDVTLNSDMAVSPKPSENPKEPPEREGALSLEAAIALLDAEFPDKAVRKSLSRMAGMKRLLTPTACRQWLTNEKEARQPERRPRSASPGSSPINPSAVDHEAFAQFLRECHSQDDGTPPAEWLNNPTRQREFTNWNFAEAHRTLTAVRAASKVSRIGATYDPTGAIAAQYG